MQTVAEKKEELYTAIETLKAVGLTDLIAEKQAQLHYLETIEDEDALLTKSRLYGMIAAIVGINVDDVELSRVKSEDIAGLVKGLDLPLIDLDTRNGMTH